MKKINILAAVLVAMAGRGYAADFAGLQSLEAGDVSSLTRADIPVPAQGRSGSADRELSEHCEESFMKLEAGAAEIKALEISAEERALLLEMNENARKSVELTCAALQEGRDVLTEKALRGNAGFAVGNVSIKIETLNFTLGEVSAKLVCRFKDGSGGVESRPEQELAVKVSGAGQIRQVDISAGRLSHFSLFSSPKSCRYILNVRSAAGTYGDFTLAGSMFNMTREELDALLSDTRLNEKISAQNQPLRLVARNGWIIKAGAAE